MNITYRNLLVEEAREFWNMMNALDSETKYMMYEPGERKEKANNIDRLKMMIQDANEGENLLLIAEVDGEIIGYISAQKGTLQRILHTAYLVMGIRKKYQGQGIGTEFFRQLDHWAKEQMVTRLELTVMCPNTVAKHLYEKNGFVVEGIKKKSMLIDGNYVDEYYMGKIL